MNQHRTSIPWNLVKKCRVVSTSPNVGSSDPVCQEYTFLGATADPLRRISEVEAQVATPSHVQVTGTLVPTNYLKETGELCPPPTWEQHFQGITRKSFPWEHRSDFLLRESQDLRSRN